MKVETANAMQTCDADIKSITSSKVTKIMSLALRSLGRWQVVSPTLKLSSKAKGSEASRPVWYIDTSSSDFSLLVTLTYLSRLRDKSFFFVTRWRLPNY
jgi:hypothetical protein